MVSVAPHSPTYGKRQRYNQQLSQLKTTRKSWEPTWRDLGDYVAPYAHELNLGDASRGERRDSNIIDATALLSLRTAGAGMMAGLTNPAREWFELTTVDPGLVQSKAVENWLEDSTSRLRASFLKSNLYGVLPEMYESLLAFGTGCVTELEDPTDSLFLFGSLPLGSYYCANNARNVVDILMREYRMTGRQMLEAFGWDNLSEQVRAAVRDNNVEAKFDVVWVLQTNPEWNPRRLESRFKRFVSCYYEPGSGPGPDTVLKEEGFDEFPAFVPRWKTKGQDVWGRGPALDILGAAKAIQAYEYKIALGLDKTLDPPTIAGPGIDLSSVSFLPGGVTQASDAAGAQSLKPLYQVDFRVDQAEAKAEQIRRSIRRGLYEDLFLMIANDTGGKMTAREIVERHEEKMLALGPVLLRLNPEALSPLIARSTAIMFRRGKLAPPPPELEGQELKVEFVSVLAQAAKMVEATGLEQHTQSVLAIGAVVPSVLDVQDFDETVRQLGKMKGVSPRTLRDAKAVDQIRQQRQQAAAAQQQAEQQQMAADTAAKLASADTSGKNALTDVANAMANEGGFQQ